MAGSRSNYLENAQLNGVLGGETYIPPANISVALYNSAPDDTGGGVEVTGGGYQRMTLANDTTNWPTTTSSSKSNGVTITFPQATESWGNVSSFAIFDDATVPNMLYWGTMEVTKNIALGDTLFFEIGAITISAD